MVYADPFLKARETGFEEVLSTTAKSMYFMMISKNQEPRPTKKTKDDSYITKTAVLERPGWSARLVTKLLGEPDVRKKMYGRSVLLALYARDRVEAVEASHEFQSAQAALAKRKSAAKKAVITKTEKLLEEVKAMPVSVVKWNIKRVRKAAIDSYNDWHQGSKFASHGDDPSFLDRITVNFIRHELTEYDEVLYEKAGKTGFDVALLEISNRIFSAIEKAYPELSKECRRQMEERRVGTEIERGAVRAPAATEGTSTGRSGELPNTLMTS